jgi:ubiquinone/menaquinone biosynthesis C-methylase UbiE
MSPYGHRRLQWAVLAVALSLLSSHPGATHPFPEEAETIAELIGLRPGMNVADVGAGNGEWGEVIASRLEELGHVYLTEIDDDELTKLRRRIKRSKLGNMSVVVGSGEDTGLPDGCCDAILLRLVYHHMTDRPEMRASLKRSLRADARLLVVEMDDNGHGIPAERLEDEMTGDGFHVVSRHPKWGGHDDHYAVLFRP